MSGGLASVEPDGSLYRLGRQPDPWAWPDWSYAGRTGPSVTGTTIPRRATASSTRRRSGSAPSSRPSLAFRLDLEVLAELEQIEGDDEPPPAVPRAWLNKRILGEATAERRFVDVG